MNEITSHRVKLLRFPLILLVLYIHSFIAPLTYGDTRVSVVPAQWLVILSTALSDGFARSAVPLFFLMSGYLFFLDFDGSLQSYRKKLRRRIGTLLVPYLFWNLLTFGLIAGAQSVPATAGYFNAGNTRIADASPFALIDMVVGITHYPISYPFWFIRDLMVIVLLSPLIHWLVKRLGLVVPVVLWLWWTFALPFPTVPALEGIAWFVIGAWIGLRHGMLFPPVAWLRWLGPIYLLLLAVDVAQRIPGPGLGWFHNMTIMTGAALVLALASWAERSPRLAAGLVTLSSASFFVFAAHEPLMTLSRKLLYRALPPSQGVISTSYVLLPLLIATILVVLYFLLRRIAPRFTAVVSGGR